MDPITDRQRQVLQYIAEAIRERGFPPTIREIGCAFKIRSTNGVNDHLKALERRGFLRRSGQKSRTLVPTASGRQLLGMDSPPSEERTLDVPLLGRVAAGAPLLAEQQFGATISIDRALMPPGGKIFGLSVKGDSMIVDGILDGDVVFVRSQPTAGTGQIVVAMIEGEATVKRFFPEAGRIRLQPSNPARAPIFIEQSAGREASILGVVVGVYRRVRVSVRPSFAPQP